MAEPLRVSGPSAPRSHSPAGTLPALPASRCSRRRLQRLLTCRAVACATSTPARQRLPSGLLSSRPRLHPQKRRDHSLDVAAVLAVGIERRPDLLDHLAGLLALPRDQARALLLALRFAKDRLDPDEENLCFSN